MKRAFLTLLVLASACNREEQPQAPTTEESDQLNDAEDMLDELAKEEGAAPEGTAPSNQSE